LKKKFLVPHSKSSNLLRSTFCPIMSFRQGTCAGMLKYFIISNYVYDF